MDSLITAAARALALGDPLGALNRVALRDDAPALALRGIAMAQLGDLDRASALLARASKRFGDNERLERARCILAQAEIALATRDLSRPTKSMESALSELEQHGDLVNAAHAKQLAVRKLVLIGHLPEAERRFAKLSSENLPPSLRATHELMAFGIAVKRLRIGKARDAIERARRFAVLARIPALLAEIETASRTLSEPAALHISRGARRAVLLDEVEALTKSSTLIVDACRYSVRLVANSVPLTRRPVLFMLLRELGEAWPQAVPRSELIARVFRTKHADETHRVRLRVEMGRLRKSIRSMADISATKAGFVLAPKSKEVVVLAPPIDDEHAAVLALLADGESWSSSAAAVALNLSQRTVQRSLESLAAQAKIQKLGRGRACRWTAAPLPGFATTLLLPTLLPGD